MARKAVQTNGFGGRFRDARKQLGLNQDHFSAVGVDRATISKVENDHNKATGADLVAALAAGLGTDVETFRLFWADQLTVAEIVSRANPRRLPAPVVTRASPTDGEPRWLALLELLRDRFPAGRSVRAVAEVPPLPSREWGDYYAAAKRALSPDRELDFAVESGLPGGPSPDAVRRKFVPKKRG